MAFKVISGFTAVQTIARGKGIRELRRLNRIYGIAHWRKKKGFASIQFDDGPCFCAELHWYEANGIGKRELKVKSLIEKL